MSKTIKLHTALKVKNRLAGEVSRLQGLVQRENSRRNDNPSKVDRSKLVADLDRARSQLIHIKSVIAAANVPIYRALAEMEEAKAYLTFLQTVPTREGDEVIPTHTGQLTYQWNVHWTRADIDQMATEVQDSINKLQDEVDAYNGSTTVTVEGL